MAYVGCIAGAIAIGDYRNGLVQAGFAHVEIIDTGSDLNAYAKVENQSSCCSPAMGTALPLVAASSCCSPTPSNDAGLHGRLADLLRRHERQRLCGQCPCLRCEAGLTIRLRRDSNEPQDQNPLSLHGKFLPQPDGRGLGQTTEGGLGRALFRRHRERTD